MIEYLEEFLGLTAGELHTPFGVMICSVLLAVGMYAILKVVLHWLETIFGRR